MKILWVALTLACTALTPLSGKAQTAATAAVSSTQQLSPAAAPRLQQAETVTVTGSYGSVPLQEADRSLTVIEVGQTSTAYRSWADALADAAALDVEQRTPGTAADVSLRGSSYGQTLILVNGMRVNDPQTGHGDLDLPLPFVATDRIEVLEGAGSTLYGSNAMAGAINFLTRAPLVDEWRLAAAGGSWGTDQQSGAAAMVGRWFDEQVAFTREHSTGFRTGRDYRNLALSAETGIRTTLGRSDLLLGLTDRPFGAAGFYGVDAAYGSWERTKGWLAALTQPLGTQTTASFAYRRHSDVYIYVKSAPSLYENNHVATDYQATLRRFEKLASTMRLYYGADALREHIASSNLGLHTRDQLGLYASFDTRAWRRFSLTAGAREELYTGGRQVFSPSLSGAAWLNAHLKLRASLSHGFRLPDYTQLYYHDPSHVANAALKPEQSWSGEGGLQLFLASTVTLEATVFQHRDRDVIDYVRPAGSAAAYQAANLQRLNFTGAELQLRWQPTRQQRIKLAYVGTHGSTPRAPGEQFLYAYNFPVHRGVASWWATLPGGADSRLRLEAVARYNQEAYALLDWSLARQFARWKPYVQLTNLADVKYKEVVGVPMPGRGFLAGMEWSWRARRP